MIHTFIYLSICVIVLYILIRKDINNYRYARECFNLIVTNPEMKYRYNPRMTKLGILYTYIYIPKDTPLPYIMELLQGRLMMLDEALMMMNLDGVVEGEQRELGVNEKDETVYLIKFVPTFQRLSFWFIIKWLVLCLLSNYLINKFGLWVYVDQLLNL